MILVVDDDERLTDMLSAYLEEHGFTTKVEHEGMPGLVRAAEQAFDAVILDLMLPDIDGFEVCRRLRSVSDVPVIMLTARGDPADRVRGLDIGADDYLPKPFDPDELVARLRAILRRPRHPAPTRTGVLRVADLDVDVDARVARLAGAVCDLTAFQFDILVALAENAGRPLSRDALMARVRGVEYGAFDRSIDIHVSRIRAKIEEDPKHPRRLLTIRGVGYVLVTDPEAAG